MERQKSHMARSLFDRVAEEVGRESPYTELWPAFMGESMLLGDELFDRLAFARRAGCKKITLNTNGTLLNEKTIPRVIEGNWDRMIVSCDAHTPETHAKVRPGRKTQGLRGIYASVLDLIDRMQAQKLSRPILEMQFSI
jgi:MoaA/NifB/PqqE/SkfB family radical SAM enzyme